MKRKKYLWVCLALALLVAVLTLHEAVAGRVYHPENVMEAVYVKGSMYGIDLKDSDYNLFWTKPSGETKVARVKGYGDGGLFQVGTLIADGGSVVYVSGSQAREDGSEDVAIYRFDFETGKLSRHWELPDAGDGYFWFLYMSETQGPMAVFAYDSYMSWYRLEPDGDHRFWRNFALPERTLIISPEDTGRMWAYDMFGNLYAYDEQGSLRTLFENDGRQLKTDNINFQMIDGEIRFFNLTQQAWYAIQQTARDGLVHPAKEAELVEPESFDLRRMGLNEYDDDEGVYYGILPLEDGRQVPAVYGAREQVYDGLPLERSVVLGDAALALVWREGLLVVALAVFWLLFLRRKRFPLWERVMVCVIPVFALGYPALAVRLDSAVQASVEERQMEQLLFYLESEIPRVRELAFARLNEEERMLPEMEVEISGAVYLRHFGDEYYEEVSRGENTALLPSLYYVRGKELYSAVSFYQYNVPLRYTVPARIYEAISRAAAENTPVWLNYNDESGRWQSVCVPVTDAQGRVEGVYQASILMEDELRASLAAAARVRRNVALLSAGVAGLVLLLLYANTRSLEKLFRAVQKAAEGDRSVRAQVRGHSEAAAAGQAFNEMLTGLDENLRGLEEYNRRYEAFVPRKLFALMGADSVDEVCLGDEKELRASLMTVGGTGLTGGSLAEIISAVRSGGGTVVHISETELDAVVAAEAAQALSTAVSLLQRRRQANLRLCLTCGYIRLGIVGGPERMAVELASESLRFGGFLRELAGACGASLLASGRFMEEAGAQAASYHRRLLGYAYMEAEDRLEPVWELLDGEPQARFLQKEETRALFEQGVRLFMVGEFAKARRAFIRVLEQDRDDRAASRYSFLCDARMAGQAHGAAAEAGRDSLPGSARMAGQEMENCPVCLAVFRKGRPGN